MKIKEIQAYIKNNKVDKMRGFHTIKDQQRINVILEKDPVKKDGIYTFQLVDK